MNRKTWFQETLELCKELGYRTTPVFENGSTKPFSEGQDYKELKDYKGSAHIGLVLDNKILLDYDGNKSEDIMSVDDLADKFDLFEMPDPAQIKGDSIHWLFNSVNVDYPLKASSDGYFPHIDIKSGNQLMHLKIGKELNLIPGLDDAPKLLMEALRTVEFVNHSDSKEDLGDFAGLINESSTPDDKVLSWLNKLDNNVSNSEWVKIGQALHEWDSVKGLQLWDDWSKGGDTYVDGECEKRWKSFKKGKGVTLGTIAHKAKQADYVDTKSKVDQVIENINASDEQEIELSIAPKVQKIELDTLGRERIAKAIQDRIKSLSNVKMPISTCRAMVTQKVVLNEGELVDESEKPGWCKNWVYVNSHNAFVHVNNLEVCKSEAFNVRNGRYVPLTDAGAKQSAVKYVADNGYVELVSSMAYMPMCDKPICNINGKPVLNSFDFNSVPKQANEFTDQGLQTIERIKKHIRFICGNDKDADILTQWLAHQVQYQGKKILWSPVIQSIEGVGKSFFGELMRHCLGSKNVGVVAPSQATSDFNGWATGVTLNVLEELRVKGHNRHETVNALKPLITDAEIQINEKGIKPYITLNTSNYICFTNFKDALPVSIADRRWWVIFAEIQSLDDLSTFVGEDKETYFPTLFNSMRANVSEIRKWLIEYPITDEFKNLKQAPMTVHKQMMVATEEANHNGVDEAKELIEKGGEYFNSQAISSSDFFELLQYEYPDLQLNTNGKFRILTSLGYSQLPTPIKIDGKTRRIWVKNYLNNDQVRESFSK
jgi:hypothetical protein